MSSGWHTHLGILAEATFRSGAPEAARQLVAEALQRVGGAEQLVKARLEAAAARYR